MIVKTAQQIVDSARPVTRHDTDNQVTDPQLFVWLAEHVRALHSMASRECKSQYTLSTTFAIASGSIVTVGSGALAGLAAADYLDFRGLDLDAGGGYYTPLKPLNFRGRGTVDGRRYMLRGNTIELYPTLNAVGTYRLWYLGTVMSVTVPIASTSFTLPEGGDLWLSEALAARIRVRLQQDPSPHTTLQDLYWKEIIKPWLASRNAADGQAIAQVEDDEEPFLS